MPSPLKTITAFPLVKFCQDSVGEVNAIGNYSVTPNTFFAKPSPTQDYVIRLVSIHFTFSGTQLAYNNYAAIAALTNGITIKSVGDEGTILDLTNGQPIKQNDNFVHFGTGLDTVNFSGNFVSITAEFLFSDDRINAPITIKGGNNEQLNINLNDDFTGMLDHHFIVKGHINNSAGYR